MGQQFALPTAQPKFLPVISSVKPVVQDRLKKPVGLQDHAQIVTGPAQDHIERITQTPLESVAS